MSQAALQTLVLLRSCYCCPKLHAEPQLLPEKAAGQQLLLLLSMQNAHSLSHCLYKEFEQLRLLTACVQLTH
jgi:hypothetical protein